eukprot:scaffold2141_cov282-Pinguiococcus_pyrenoidosus.AAC.16
MVQLDQKVHLVSELNVVNVPISCDDPLGHELSLLFRVQKAVNNSRRLYENVDNVAPARHFIRDGPGCPGIRIEISVVERIPQCG